MARGRRREEWSYRSLWLSMYSAAHGVERTPDYYLPDDLKNKQEKRVPAQKISLRQLAAAQGHRFEDDNGSGSRRG
jgi:hypothetical protein